MDPNVEPSVGAASVEVGEISIPLNAEGMRDFVLSGLYRSWPSKSAERSSLHEQKVATAHYNRILIEARDHGLSVSPRGSMAITEEDLPGGQELDGYSLVIKIDDGLDSHTWLWWRARVTDLMAPVVFGTAHPDCERCHSGGTDRILATDLPHL